MDKPKCLQPSSSLLCKLGSIISHFEEAESSNGHWMDKLALEHGLQDPEVVEWLEEMRSLALISRKR